MQNNFISFLVSCTAVENPIFLMEEGTVTLIRLVAPVKNAYDAVASMMLMPIISVDIAYGDGTLQRLLPYISGWHDYCQNSRTRLFPPAIAEECGFALRVFRRGRGAELVSRLLGVSVCSIPSYLQACFSPTA